MSARPAKSPPLYRWKLDSDLTYGEIAALCKKHGLDISPAYAKATITARRRPVWEDAKLWEQVTGGKVTAPQIMDFATAKRSEE